jgi:hypothetical protein
MILKESSIAPVGVGNEMDVNKSNHTNPNTTTAINQVPRIQTAYSNNNFIQHQLISPINIVHRPSLKSP